MSTDLQFSADLFVFSKQILTEKVFFECSEFGQCFAEN